MRFVPVPAGPFAMGSDPRLAFPPEAVEGTPRTVHVEAFRVSRVPVTNAQYRGFVEATGRPAPGHWPAPEADPVTYVDWDDASAYGRWVGGALPSEEQWERAARGDDDRLWPWGDTPPDATRANFGGTPGQPSTVGCFPAGASPFGILDLAGNVWEWTASQGLRGGSYIHGSGELRCSARQSERPDTRDPYIGFRVIAAPGAGSEQIDWVDVPAGNTILGIGAVAYRGPALPTETPPHIVEVEAFEIGRTPVTNAEYAEFVAATGRTERGPGRLDFPVTHVDWHDAVAFAAWAGARLPTEAEWEKSARGDDGRIFPWGDTEPTQREAVFAASGTAPVDARPAGASPCGALDLAGNVWEWVASAYRPYPYDPVDGRDDPDVPEPRVLRGGSFASPGSLWLRCASRSSSYPTRRRGHIGFRVARGEAHA